MRFADWMVTPRQAPELVDDRCSGS